MPVTIIVGGRGARSQFREWTGPIQTDPTLGSFARIPKNPVPLPTVVTGTLTFTSQNPLVATVSSAGEVTAVAPGETFITCVDQSNGFRATDRVTVILPPPTVAPTLNLVNN